MEIRFTIGNTSIHLNPKGELIVEKLNKDGIVVGGVIVSSNTEEALRFHQAISVVVNEQVRRANELEQAVAEQAARNQGTPTQGGILHGPRLH